MFTPPRCPHSTCPAHADPSGDFFIRLGTYQTKSKPRPIPRFRCRVCDRGFSRQTFRHDYRDKKPHLNERVVELQCSGVGLRQGARIVGLTRRNFAMKVRKIQRTVGALDRNLLERAGDVDRASPRSAPFEVQFDEFETYELCRNTMPLTVPTAVETGSRLILGSIAAPIRPRGKMTERRKLRIDRHEKRYGSRVDQSARACQAVFERVAAFRPAATSVLLDTDFKSTYAAYAAQAFEGKRLTHRQTLSSAPRDQNSRLAAINLTEAMMRDLMGRLRRQSWLVSKKCKYLNMHLGLYAGWRNWVRPRFNRDGRCPGEISGFAKRRLKRSEIVGWRQDWGQRSPSPYGNGLPAVADLWAGD